MTYAIISIGGKQHRVREGEWLLVDRLPHDEGATFQPDVLLIGNDGETLLGDELGDRQVTARVSAHVLGKKVIVGKHRRRTGYRRRNGFRARLSRIEIESIAAKPARAPRAKPARKAPTVRDEAAAAEVATEEKPKRAPRAAAKPKAEAKPAEPAAKEAPDEPAPAAPKPRASRAKRTAESGEAEAKPKTTPRRSKPDGGE
jgi:large subunit ribosomal protein L21